MKKAIISALLILCLLFSFSGCNVHGSTRILDKFSPDALYTVYQTLYYNRDTVSWDDETDIPVISGFTRNKAGNYAVNTKVCVKNESQNDITFYGYSWISFDINRNQNAQGFYYNKDKKTNYSAYKIRIRPGYGSILQFDHFDEPMLITPDTVVFLFLEYNSTDYIAAVNMSNEFVLWPLKQTKSLAEQNEKTALH